MLNAASAVSGLLSDLREVVPHPLDLGLRPGNTMCLYPRDAIRLYPLDARRL